MIGGTAFAWTEDQAGPANAPGAPPSSAPESSDGWLRLEGKQAMTMAQQKAAKPEDAARTAIDRCTAEATAARDLAAAVASPDASLALLAPRHVIARQLARAACDVALLRVALVPRHSPARASLAMMLRDVDSSWRAARPRLNQGPGP